MLFESHYRSVQTVTEPRAVWVPLQICPNCHWATCCLSPSTNPSKPLLSHVVFESRYKSVQIVTEPRAVWVPLQICPNCHWATCCLSPSTNPSEPSLSHVVSESHYKSVQTVTEPHSVSVPVQIRPNASLLTPELCCALYFQNITVAAAASVRNSGTNAAGSCPDFEHFINATDNRWTVCITQIFAYAYWLFRNFSEQCHTFFHKPYYYYYTILWRGRTRQEKLRPEP